MASLSSLMSTTRLDEGYYYPDARQQTDVHTDDPSTTPLLDHDLRCSTQTQEYPTHINIEYIVEIGKGSY
jgi:hypothetical protein